MLQNMNTKVYSLLQGYLDSTNCFLTCKDLFSLRLKLYFGKLSDSRRKYLLSLACGKDFLNIYRTCVFDFHINPFTEKDVLHDDNYPRMSRQSYLNFPRQIILLSIVNSEAMKIFNELTKHERFTYYLRQIVYECIASIDR